MLSINTNLSSLIAQQSLSSSTSKLNQAIERMSTGFKINHAKDNAANYSIATSMTTKINAYMVAEDNVAMGLDMLSTANGSLDQISDKLTRIRSLATQASNGTYGAQSLNAINSEVNALVDEINRLYSTAEYNGIKLFGKEQAEPAAASYAMARAGAAGGPGSFYTDEEIAAMTTLSEAYNEGSFSSGVTYSINSLEELKMFRDMVDWSRDTTGATFVLTSDIDMSSISNWDPIGNDVDGYVFCGTFDGNGYVISNLTIDLSDDCVGLFDYTSSATIQNLGLENVNVKGTDYVGGLVGFADNTTITNCYVTGSVEASDNVGGLVGYAGGAAITNCYTNCIVEAERRTAGGFIGGAMPITVLTIENCFATGDVSADDEAGGFIGWTCWDDASITIANCYSLGEANSNDYYGGFIGYDEGFVSINNYNVQANVNTWGDPDITTQKTKEEILSPANLESMGFTEANGWTIVNGQPVASYSMTARNANAGGGTIGGSNYVTLQVGINSDEYSQIGLEFGFSLEGLDDLRMIGLDTTTDFLTQLDNMLSTVSAKATEYGSAQNRLESALDEISTQYENLVSSRSTIRDADIAEESSEYIRQQILQQASATLLATANQSPSIALQLI